MLASLLAWANFNLALVFWTKFVSTSSCCLSVTNCDPNKAAWSPYVEAKLAWSAWIIFVNSATLFSESSIFPFNLLILDIIFCCSVKSVIVPLLIPAVISANLSSLALKAVNCSLNLFLDSKPCTIFSSNSCALAEPFFNFSVRSSILLEVSSCFFKASSNLSANVNWFPPSLLISFIVANCSFNFSWKSAALSKISLNIVCCVENAWLAALTKFGSIFGFYGLGIYI